jgi:hypothetical protein
MTMEKNGEIREDITPPENKGCKTSCGCKKSMDIVGPTDLEEHLSKRLAEKVAEAISSDELIPFRIIKPDNK